MIKYKKILFNYLIYFLVGFLICFVGITGVFADTTIDTSNWINVTGVKWSETGLFYTGNPTYNNDWLLNNYYIYSGTFINNGADWNYIEFSYFEHSGGTFNPCNSTSKFTSDFSLLFTSPGIVDQVWQVKWGNDNCAMISKNSQTGVIELSCGASPSTGQQTDIFVYYSDSIFQQNQSYVYISRNIDISCGLNTDAIINNDNANTQNIINNNNQNTQQIIDSSASNTQALIDSNKVCSVIDNANIETNRRYLTSNGSGSNANTWGITDYIVVFNSDVRVLEEQSSQNAHACFYDVNKTLLSCIPNSSLVLNSNINLPNNTYYARFSISNTNNIPKFTLCKNGSQALDDSLNDLNDTLNDSSSIDISSLGDTVGWLPPGPIDSIINLPLNLLNNLLTALNGTCAPLHVPIPYLDNKYLDIPCISTIFNQIEGLPNFWTWVGAICSVMMLYKYLIALYKYYDDLTTLKANFISDFGGAP